MKTTPFSGSGFLIPPYPSLFPRGFFKRRLHPLQFMTDIRQLTSFAFLFFLVFLNIVLRKSDQLKDNKLIIVKAELSITIQKDSF